MGRVSRASAAAWVLAALVAASQARAMNARMSARPLVAFAIVPQSRSFSVSRQTGAPSTSPVAVTGVTVGVVIVEQAATTTMDIGLQNTTGWRQQAELVVPVPDGAVLRGFTFEGNASAPTAQVLPRDEARRVYDSIVNQVRDPALLEFVGSGLVRSSVFPLEPRSPQKVRLIYEHVLASDGRRTDYVLPRSEALDGQAPWAISVRILSRRPVATVYSPTHRLEVARPANGGVSARVAADSTADPGPFCLSFLQGGEGVAASVLAYPDPRVGGGYFLLLAGLPARNAEPPSSSFVESNVLPALNDLTAPAQDGGQASSDLRGPALASPQLRAYDPDRAAARSRVRNLLPEKLPDLFEGDQLLLVGQYVGKEPLTLEVRGSSLGRERGFRFRLDPGRATTRNAFVPRLWASRRIDALVAAIEQHGAGAASTSAQPTTPSDPGSQALVQEIVRLSTEFGILTPYTSLFAREGTHLTSHTISQRSERAFAARRLSPAEQREPRRAAMSRLAPRDRDRPASDTVRRVSDRTFYRRGDRWVDSLLVGRVGRKAEPSREVALGSKEFFTLAERLAGEGRQGVLSLPGDTLLMLDGQAVLVRHGAEARATDRAAR